MSENVSAEKSAKVSAAGFGGKGVAVAIVVAAILTVGGLALWAFQLTSGMVNTNMRNLDSWGLYITMFMFLVGLSAGGLIISSAPRVFGMEGFGGVSKIAVWTSICCTVLAIGFVVIDLGQPLRLWELFVYSNLGSPLMWDIIVLGTYLILSIVYLWAMLRFEGGKGVATALGVLLGISGWLGLATALTWLIIAVFFRYSSLAALVASIFAPVYYVLCNGIVWNAETPITAAIVASTLMRTACTVMLAATFTSGCPMRAYSDTVTDEILNDVHGYPNWHGKAQGPAMVNWLPTMSMGSYTGQYQAGWTVTGNDDYLVYGGEFPRELSAIRALPGAKGRLIVTPGIRPAGSASGDQKRIATPGQNQKHYVAV